MASKTEMTLGQTMMAANAPMMLQRTVVEGRPDEGVMPSGQVAGIIDDVPSCEALVASIMGDANARLKHVGA